MKRQDGYIVLYHKSADETIKMTKTASFQAASGSAHRFERIGIAPCEVVKVVRSRKKYPAKK